MDNRNKYVKDTLDGQRLRRSLLDCEKTTVQREAQLIEISSLREKVTSTEKHENGL